MPGRPGGLIVKVSVLVVDDELLIRKLLGKVLRAQGYVVDVAERRGRGPREDRLAAAAGHDPRQATLPEHRRGQAAAEGARALDPLLQMIMITAFGDVQTAVDAMKLGRATSSGSPTTCRTSCSRSSRQRAPSRRRASSTCTSNT
jgi:DNA-binding NtrC family response regulator